MHMVQASAPSHPLHVTGGRNVKHISEQTGAAVWLCGRGSGLRDHGGEDSEPLHMLVKSHDKDGQWTCIGLS